VNERDRMLTGIFQRSLGVSREQEDELWARFTARLQEEEMQWVAFATTMAAFIAGLRPALRAGGWPAGLRVRT
jgi:hypothetical protein